MPINQIGTIRKLQEENKRLQKIIAAKSDVVSLSTHQIRTALAALKWIVKMFLDGDLGKLTAEQENLMIKAYESNEKAIQVLNELLLSNKTEAVVEKKYVFTKVDIVEMIESVIFDFSGETHAKGIEMIFLKSETKTRHVNADKEKLLIVLQNLVENAVKYSEMHGKVFITLSEKDGMMQVSVKDKGIGISEEGKQKIFEKFFRDAEAQKKEAVGSGIGLFTTKGIVEKNGGEIWFESTKNEGTTFSFTVPIFK